MVSSGDAVPRSNPYQSGDRFGVLTLPEKPWYIKLGLNLVLFLPAALAISLIFWGYVVIQASNSRQRIISNAERNLSLFDQIIKKELELSLSDLSFLSRNDYVRLFFTGGDQTAKKHLVHQMALLFTSRGIYDQLRYLDLKGMEIIRIDRHAGLVENVTGPKLQDKGNRYYFMDAVDLGPGKFYVSPLDLNIENQKIEIPFKPMIRISMPVYDSTGRKLCVLVMNILAQKLLDNLTQSARENDGRFLLLNKDGYYLIGMQPQDEWGFMLAERQGRSFPNDYPGQWDQMKGQAHGNIMSADGLFVYGTVNPIPPYNTRASEAVPDMESNPDVDGYPWKVVIYYPEKLLNSGIFGGRDPAGFFYLLLLTLTGLGSFFGTRILNSRRAAREQAELIHREWVMTFNNVPDFIAIIDQDNRVKRVNRALAQRFGRNDDELTGLSCRQLFFPDGCEPSDCGMLNHLLEEKTFDLHIQWLDLYLLVSTTPLFDRLDNLIGGICVARDITALKLTEAELNRHRENLQELVDEKTAQLMATNEELRQEVVHRTQAEESYRLEALVNSAMAELSSSLLTTTSLSNIFEVVLKQVTEMTSSPYGCVGYIMPDGKGIREIALTRDVSENCHMKDKESILYKSRGLWGKVINERRLVMANDVDHDPDTVGTPPGHAAIHRFMAAPALGGDKLLGIIAVANSKSEYLDRDAVIITRQAALMALAVERYWTEKSLERYKREHSFLFESINQGVLYFNRAGEILLANPVAERILGRRFEEMRMMGKDPEHPNLGEDWMEFPPSDFPVTIALKTGQVVKDVVMGIYNPKEDDYRWLNIFAMPMFEGDYATPNRVYAVFTDITETRRIEGELREKEVARKTAEHASKMKDQFFSFINHELRTPLNSILGFAQTIQRLDNRKKLTLEKTRPMVVNIEESARHLSSLIEDMLDLARMESGQFGVDLQPVDLHQVEDTLYSTLYGQATEKEIELISELPEDLPMISADTKRLTQVLINVVANAIKFTEKGWVKISGQYHDADRPRVLITVSDSGIGIPDTMLESVFDRFTRVEQDGLTPGTGLGLAISRQLVEKMQGRIWVESTFGEGTTFHILMNQWEDKA